MLQNAFWQTSCLHNSVDGVPMSATSASPRSHVDSFSLLVLPKRLTLNFRYNLYPHRALALLVHSPSPPSSLLLSQQTPSLLPFTFTSLTHRGIRRDPPSAAHCSIHTPSPHAPCLRVGTQLPSCGSCAFSPALSRFPSSRNHFPQRTGTLQ